MLPDLPEGYRLHVEWALWWAGIREPEVTETGEVTGRVSDAAPRVDLLGNHKSVETVAQALVLADVASGATIGAGLLATVAAFRGVECETRRDVLFPTHRELLSYVQLSHDHVARRLDLQLRRKKWAW